MAAKNRILAGLAAIALAGGITATAVHTTTVSAGGPIVVTGGGSGGGSSSGGGGTTCVYPFNAE
jgi:hypothetical protein